MDSVKEALLYYTILHYIYYLYKYISNFITESDGSNDSGTSSFGSENKNNQKLPLSKIPFIESIKVKQVFTKDLQKVITYYISAIF